MFRNLFLAVAAVLALAGLADAHGIVSVRPAVVSPFVPVVTVQAPVFVQPVVSTVAVTPSYATVAAPGCAVGASYGAVQTVQTLSTFAAYPSYGVGFPSVAVFNHGGFFGSHFGVGHFGGGFRRSAVNVRVRVR